MLECDTKQFIYIYIYSDHIYILVDYQDDDTLQELEASTVVVVGFGRVPPLNVCGSSRTCATCRSVEIELCVITEHVS